MDANHVDILVEEYRTILLEVAGASGDMHDLSDDIIEEKLKTVAEWTPQGAAAVLMLARHYGTFVLSNALALAEALEIEDGDCHI
ncbi:MAG: hypothetical protein HY287_12580 [Planctomycetes bacterium]|nr:hypothetical protein [Planctomycetota bacterium]MBI3835158.1 hypothetical protein [Planctomycetota bacterium]